MISWYYALWAIICSTIGIRGIWIHSATDILFGLLLAAFCASFSIYMSRRENA